MLFNKYEVVQRVFGQFLISNPDAEDLFFIAYSEESPPGDSSGNVLWRDSLVVTVTLHVCTTKKNSNE